MSWLIRLYPARWRDRYGGELEQLVRDLQPSTRTAALAVDLIKGAARAHIQQGYAMQTADRRAIGRGLLIAAIVGVGLAAEIFLTNVSFPSKSDNDAIPVLLSYLCVFAALFLSGVLAARGGAGRRGQLLAGLVAGVVIAILTVATFAVVDNVWLDIVSQQQTKIDGLARSGGGSMRAYINNGLIGAAVFLTVMFGVLGAVLGVIGGIAGRVPRSPSAAGGSH